MAEIVRWGESFRVAEKIGALPLMRFAQVARRGTDSGDLEGLAAMGDLLDQCIHPDDLGRFSYAANQAHADGEELMEIVKDVFAVIAGRPTSRPSDSSDGPSTTSESSAGDSSSSVVSRLERQGRPDLALVASQAERSLASA